MGSGAVAGRRPLAPPPASVLHTPSTAACTSASLAPDCTNASGASLALCVSIWSLTLLCFVSRTCGEERELEKPAKDPAFESK